VPSEPRVQSGDVDGRRRSGRRDGRDRYVPTTTTIEITVRAANQVTVCSNGARGCGVIGHATSVHVLRQARVPRRVSGVRQVDARRTLHRHPRLGIGCAGLSDVRHGHERQRNLPRRLGHSERQARAVLSAIGTGTDMRAHM